MQKKPLQLPIDKVAYSHREHAQLEAYLQLVRRLENKVKKINFAIGNDQSVLGEKENPIEYVENLYSENATEYAKTLEDDEGFLSEDEYVNDLRRFMKVATPEQLRFLERIPHGKWGYLPHASVPNPDCPAVLSLVRVATKSEVSRSEADIFVASNGDISDPVETLEALSFLRTTEAENDRRIDTFTHDKLSVRRLVEAQAANEAVTASAPTKLKPSQASVLDELARVLPGLQFQSVIQNVMTVQDKKKWEKLFSEAHKNIKEHGQLMPQTIESLKSAYDSHDSSAVDVSDLTVESIEAALFYAK